jgi:hypothetical protein
MWKLESTIMNNTNLIIQTELGGPGIIVQIDESLFNHKPKYQTLIVKLLKIHYFSNSCINKHKK